MGNSLGGRTKTAKVMKVNGETLKIKTPMTVHDVVKDYPGHVLIESESVKHYGIRAKPLEPQQKLNPRKIYFLLELPKVPEERLPRRVRSGIHMTAKDRLESLKLSRRSVSDLTILNSRSSIIDGSPEGGSGVRIRVRLPKAQVDKLVQESKDGTEAAEKIMDLCIGSNSNGNGSYEDHHEEIATTKSGELYLQQQNHWKPGLGSIEETKRRRRVGFLTLKDGERLQ